MAEYRHDAKAPSIFRTSCFASPLRRKPSKFNMEDFMVDTLCLNGSTLSPARPMFQQEDPYSYLYNEDPLKILGDLNFMEQKEVPETEVGTPIQEFFRGVNVFITGGSGFLGKALTEKLLRAIPHIGHIYLLIRPTRGKSCQERFDLLMDDKIFSRMKAEKPQYRSKITALAGDLSEEGLGLRVEDRQLLQESVHVVFHSAADVSFLEPLRKAITINVLGSKRVMELAKNMTNLKAYVHVSTAYSQCVHKVIEEKVPRMSMNYKDILSYVELNTDRHIEDNLQKILQGWPNTYTFSKAVCEDMIQEEAKGLPVVIFRPAVVSPTHKEPVRGWTDNLNGSCGLMLAMAVGLIHIFRLSRNQTTDLVPVDYVVNCMIASAWYTSIQRSRSFVSVLNFTSSSQNMMMYNSVLNYDKLLSSWPAITAFWCPSLVCTKSSLIYGIGSFLLHTIPGYCIDKVSLLFGKKPRLMKIYNKINKTDGVIQYFLLKFWEFRSDNVVQLRNSLTQQDKELFNFDLRDINWPEYIKISWLGLRYYYLKESMDSIPEAKRKLKWFQLAHKCMQILCGLLVLKLAVAVAHQLPI